MTSTFRFVVPSIPGRDHSPNARVHWSTTAKARAQLRRDTCLSIAHARGEQRNWDVPIFAGPVAITITVYWPKGRKEWDADNLVASCKGMIDATQDEGVVANDNQLAAPVVHQLRTTERQGYVEIEMVG